MRDYTNGQFDLTKQTKMITLADGSKLFPRNGPPPREVFGYSVDPFDEYHWIETYCQCQYRRLNFRLKMPCIKTSTGWIERNVDFCSKFNIPISQNYCNIICKEPDKT